MSGERFDYSSERQRHEKFVGRAGLLAQLDQLLVNSETDRWVVITGGPGMGKSALLAAWLARRVAAGAVVPHHFIRRGAYDWDDPAKLVGSLVAQIEDGFPDLREPDGDERMHPATRLARALSRVSKNVLRPRGERLVVLIWAMMTAPSRLHWTNVTWSKFSAQLSGIPSALESSTSVASPRIVRVTGACPELRTCTSESHRAAPAASQPSLSHDAPSSS